MSASRARGGEPRLRVLVVDDAEGIRSYLVALLEQRGYDVDTATDGRRALALLEAGAAPDLVLLDVRMPGIDGIEVLRRMRELEPTLPVIMLSVAGDAKTIVTSMREGAADFLNKPFEEEELERAISEALAGARGDDPLSAPTEREGLGEGPTLARVQALLEQIADTNVTVLIRGESGVGKERVARAVHETSTRREKPFIKVNCAALPGTLLESELFGYERGAFTGANHRKPGKFEAAEGGTVFLDEIGEMSAALQAKLLHVLQDGTFSRLGGNEELRANVRIVTATHRDLTEMVRTGHFREDLYFRLDVVTIDIPPLRERREEIVPLVEHFVAQCAARYARPPRPISARLLSLFQRYPFPGNIRELENMVKRIVVLESEAPVLSDLLGSGTGGRERSLLAFRNLLEEVEETAGDLPLREVGRRASLEAERETIERVLFQTGWNRKQAAQLLNVSYKTLLQKIRDCGLEPG